MRRKIKRIIISVYFLLLLLSLISGFTVSKTVSILSHKFGITDRIIIDPGHGGIDGGAVSCTGIPESQINLDISLKLNDLMHLLGMQTIMIRKTDVSVYTHGNTISTQKVSDIRERVRIANTTPNALVISIHQNTFSDPKYNGAQVFYNGQADSKLLAETLQTGFRDHIDQNNKRKCKKTSGVYLMEHINCCGVLIECGFLSNPQEEQNLRNPEYQNKLCGVIATTLSQYLNT